MRRSREQLQLVSAADEFEFESLRRSSHGTESIQVTSVASSPEQMRIVQVAPLFMVLQRTVSGGSTR